MSDVRPADCVTFSAAIANTISSNWQRKQVTSGFGWTTTLNQQIIFQSAGIFLDEQTEPEGICRASDMPYTTSAI